MTRLHPVWRAFSTALARRERVRLARASAGALLRASAERAGAPADLPCASWPRGANGAPASSDGWHASFTDTAGFCAALVAPVPAALDAEWLGRPRWHAARARFRESGELARLGADDRSAVLGLWTAKEAVLKLRGVGLADLGRCSLVRARGPGELVLLHRGVENLVRVMTIGEHRVAVACDEERDVALAPLAEEVGVA